jgi:DNA primase
MRFPDHFLDQIRQRVNISSVVGRHVTWDRRKTNVGKGDFWACCPFHSEKSPSFHADDRKGRYHCFGCKASGDIFYFLVEKAGLQFHEAVEQLASEAGLPLPEFSEADVKREETRASLYDIMEMAAKLFQDELHTSHGARARGYLADRDLGPAIQQEFGIGYARDDRGWLRNELASAGVALDQMIEAGLVIGGEDIPVAYDRFRDRVMFPIRDARGRVIAFGGRALSKDVPAKYLNSPETPVFVKGEVLYNFDKARAVAHQKGQIIAVEGYVDVIAMHMAGLPEAVAPLGTALTESQLAILWRTAAEPILCFDGDAAGQKAAYRALDLALPLLVPGHSLRFAFLPDGKDPDDVLRSDGADALRALVAGAESLVDVLWQRALDMNDRSSPERKAAFEKDLRMQVSLIKEDGVKRHYLDELAERFRKQRGPNSEWRMARGGRPNSPFATRYSHQGRKLREWEIPVAASHSLKSAATKLGQGDATDRRARMIVLSFINHPNMLHDFWEDFAGVELGAKELDTLRTLILDAASSNENLEQPGLKDHLIARGFGDTLNQLEGQAKRLNEWFLGPAAAPDDARTGLRQMIALHRKTVTLDRELKAAETAFANDPTEEKLNALTTVREELLSSLGSEALVPGFGAASGRNSDPTA